MHHKMLLSVNHTSSCRRECSLVGNLEEVNWRIFLDLPYYKVRRVHSNVYPGTSAKAKSSRVGGDNLSTDCCRRSVPSDSSLTFLTKGVPHALIDRLLVHVPAAISVQLQGSSHFVSVFLKIDFALKEAENMYGRYHTAYSSNIYVVCQPASQRQKMRAWRARQALPPRSECFSTVHIVQSLLVISLSAASGSSYEFQVLAAWLQCNYD